MASLKGISIQHGWINETAFWKTADQAWHFEYEEPMLPKMDHLKKEEAPITAQEYLERFK